MNTTSARIPTQSLPSEWHVASVALYVNPTHQDDLQRWLASQAGAEVHAHTSQGKMVVVLEVQNAQAILDLIDEASEREGVLNAALVYHEVIPMEDASV